MEETLEDFESLSPPGVAQHAHDLRIDQLRDIGAATDLMLAAVEQQDSEMLDTALQEMLGSMSGFAEVQREQTALLIAALKGPDDNADDVQSEETLVDDSVDLAPLVEDSVDNADVGRFEEAVATATAIIELEPDNTNLLAQAYLKRSSALSELGRFEEAVADATAAIELEPDNTDHLARAYVNRVWALAELGRFEEAESDLRKIVELLPPGHELREIAEEILNELG
jgi:tetratricopeptide (TPR) repeat protein